MLPEGTTFHFKADTKDAQTKGVSAEYYGKVIKYRSGENEIMAFKENDLEKPFPPDLSSHSPFLILLQKQCVAGITTHLKVSPTDQVFCRVTELQLFEV